MFMHFNQEILLIMVVLPSRSNIGDFQSDILVYEDICYPQTAPTNKGIIFLTPSYKTQVPGLKS